MEELLTTVDAHPFAVARQIDNGLIKALRRWTAHLIVGVCCGAGFAHAQGDARDRFAKTAREKVDRAERLIDEGDYANALQSLRDAESFDETVEPRRRAELRARANAKAKEAQAATLVADAGPTQDGVVVRAEAEAKERPAASGAKALLDALAKEADRPLTEQQPASTALDGHVLDAKVLKQLFGGEFVQLVAGPADVVTDWERRDKLLADLLGCRSRADGADDFEVKDCQKRTTALRAQKEPIYLDVLTLAEPENLQYDFKRKGWTFVFTDGLGSREVSLSVWKPTMPEKIQPTKCSGGDCWYPFDLPRKFRSLTIFIPMDEAEARAWRDTWKNGPMGNFNGNYSGHVGSAHFLVSVRQGSQWAKSYKRPQFPDDPPATHVGLLVRVHAMRVEFGKHWWASPTWYAPR